MLVFNDYSFLAKHVKNGSAQPLHYLLAIEIIKNLPVKTIIDIGGGGNTYLNHLEGSYHTTVTDVSDEIVKNTKTNNKISGVLPGIPTNDKFDLVSVLEVLEHLPPETYRESLLEISRLSGRYVLVTAPFLQDLSSAYVVCEKCYTEFQCEGHCRVFGLKEIYKLQEYFGGISELCFLGEPCGNYFIYKNIVFMKHVIRRMMQKSLGKMYCNPSFTKCPACGSEIFNDYDGYVASINKKKQNQKWWNYSNTKTVGGRFAVLFDKSKNNCTRI